MSSRYVKNLTRDHVRIGRKDNEAIILLEPEEMVTHIDPKTKQRTVKPGKNVAEIEENVINMIQVKPSLGKLIGEISQEEYEARVTEIFNWTDTSVEGNSVQGYQDRDHRLNVVTDNAVVDDSIKIDMDPQTLQIYAGSASGQQGNNR